ncbi:MAG: alginate lyase family protein [Candidatus Hydrogenedentes bacterium]|nr:alginate lyase family protein [Candidatus Hydrogenedentota bacterium]
MKQKTASIQAFSKDRVLFAISTLALTACLSACGHSTLESVPREVWESPNLLVNRDDLNRIKDNVANDTGVLKAAYAGLVSTADGMLSATPNPIAGKLEIPGYYTSKRETQQTLTRQLRQDARTAHALALAYAVTGKTAYAAKSKEFLFAWVDSLTHPVDGGEWWEFITLSQGGDTRLVITYSFPSFLYAFDLLKGEGYLKQDEIESFRAWLKPFVSYCRSEVFYKNNHHNWQVVFLMCAGHALEDPELFQTAVNYYRHGIKGQIGKEGRLPKELRRHEKAGTYTLMALEGMTQAVHLAERHGYSDLRDLRSSNATTLKDAVDFYVKYLDDPAGWAGYTNAKELNVPKDPSDWGYIFELPYRWWREDAYLAHMAKRPYGFGVERCYTLDFATLLFAEPR